MYYDYLLRSRYLAFQVRRERISERMKFLQDLVPGCSKVTGKAVMLDEIINYVQSLQRQVEVGTHHSHSCFLCFDRCYAVHSKRTKVLIPPLCSRRTSRQFVAVNSPFYLLSSWRFPMHIPIKKTAPSMWHDQVWQFVWMYHVLSSALSSSFWIPLEWSSSPESNSFSVLFVRAVSVDEVGCCQPSPGLQCWYLSCQRGKALLLHLKILNATFFLH